MAVDRDAYFTPDNVTEACVRALYEHHPELIGSPVVEPSAGGGAFLRALSTVGSAGRVIAYDLEPQAEGIIAANFLTDPIPSFEPGTVVIGNPPYGYRNATTRQFVDRAFELGASRVAFLLMASTLGFGTLKRIGRKVEGWHSLTSVFYRDGVAHKTGAVLDTMAWVVFSAEPLQPITVETFEPVEVADRASAHFSSAVIYGKPEIDFAPEPARMPKRNSCEYRTLQLGPARIFYLYRGDASEARRVVEAYPFSSVNRTPAATTLNWHREHGPTVYRGTL